MNVTTLGIGAAIGIITGTWDRIKDIFYKFYSLFVITIKVDGPAAYAVSMYIIRNFKRSLIGDIEIGSKNDFIRPLKKNQLIAMQRISSNPMLWKNDKKIISVSRNWNELKIQFIRWTLNPQKFVAEAIDAYNLNKSSPEHKNNIRFFMSRKEGTVGIKIPMIGNVQKKDKDDESPEKAEGGCSIVDKYICQLIKWKYDDIGQPYSRNAINKMSLDKDIEDAFFEIKRWYENEQWFKEHGIPWKMGLLLIGKPGTGKTEFARSVAQVLDIPIFYFDLATMTNQDFVRAWNEMMDWAPCIVLFEDIHKIFNKSKNITSYGQEAALSFNCLLNILDGIQNSEGILTFITSNSLDNIDEALGGPNGDGKMIIRPGRINQIIYFNDLTYNGRFKMANRILDGFDFNIKKELVEKYKNVTGAQFQAICTNKALELWFEKTEINDDN